MSDCSALLCVITMPEISSSALWGLTLDSQNSRITFASICLLLSLWVWKQALVQQCPSGWGTTHLKTTTGENSQHDKFLIWTLILFAVSSTWLSSYRKYLITPTTHWRYTDPLYDTFLKDMLRLCQAGGVWVLATRILGHVCEAEPHGILVAERGSHLLTPEVSHFVANFTIR